MTLWGWDCDGINYSNLLTLWCDICRDRLSTDFFHKFKAWLFSCSKNNYNNDSPIMLGSTLARQGVVYFPDD